MTARAGGYNGLAGAGTLTMVGMRVLRMRK